MKGFNAFSNLHFDLALETEHDRIETDRTEDSLAAPAANRNHGYRITPIVTPAYTYARGPFNLSLDLPLKYLHLRYTDDVRAETFRHDLLYLSPHLSLKYTASPALYFTLGGGLNHATGDILSFLRSPIRRSYNHLDSGASGILAHRRTASLTASYMYRPSHDGRPFLVALPALQPHAAQHPQRDNHRARRLHRHTLTRRHDAHR